MSDSYGSGLTFTPDAAPGLPTPPADAGPGAPLDLSPQPDAPTPQPAATAAPQDSGPSMFQQFGSGLRKMLPGPHYETPDPQSSALDQSASLLEQRVKRANSIATNPFAQIFAPEQAAAAREFVPKAVEQLQKIEQQKSAIAAGRVQAQTLGLAPGEASDQATQEDRLTIASSKALKGDIRAFQGIQAVAPERAAAIAPQVYEVVSGHLAKAQLAFDSLSSMQNEGQYRAKVNELRQNGTIAELESLGLKLPASFDAFNATKAAEGRALREARIGINTIGQKLEERNTYQPMEKKEAETYNGRLTTVFGDQITNGTWGRNGASGTRGLIVNGAADPNNLGKTFTLATPEQRKAIKEQFDGAAPKEDIEKYRAFNRTYELATTDAKGKPVPEGRINTNPNVQQGVAEGLASMLRGGSGGANVGLLKIELAKRGWAQTAIDGLVSNYAGTVNTLFKNADKPYLSQQTQKQIRDVMDVLKTYNDRNIGDRVTDIAKRAGALGLDTAALGLGKNEAAGVIGAALDAGRREQIERMKPNHQAIGGGDGVLQLGAQRPGASPGELPPGAQRANQLPGAQPLLTPVQQAGQAPIVPPAAQSGGVQPGPPPPPNAPNGGPGTAPQPVKVAGLDVNMALPPGVSPSYAQATQRIESGGTRDPWTAGTKGSSASGAFQFIDSTWRDNKPPGAPDRAKDATPEQQAQAFATLTAKNAATLKAGNMPVTDTSLYVMHNLGAASGATLLQANPDADARTLVGEAAARNNPMFFKGRPTVATVLQRYADAVQGAHGGAENEPDTGPKPRPGAGGASLAENVASGVAKAFPPTAVAAEIWGHLTPAQKEKAKAAVIDEAPALAGTAGAIGGGALAGPPGAIAGGAVGSGAGQALKDYLKGNPQSPREIAKQTFLGGVLGVASEGRPLLAAGARALGAGAVEAGADVAEKGELTADAVDAGVRGVAEAAGGEAFGRALGMVGHKVYSMFAPDARKAVQTAAKDYADATKALETQEPKLPGAGGTGTVANPEYVAAEVKKSKAETKLKDAGLNPEEAAYAHKVSSEGVPKQEAEAGKPGALEQQRIGKGYRQLEQEVGARGVGTPKASPKLPDGPVAAVEAKKVSAQHAELADHVEMAITAPAANWQEKWTQLKDARSGLLQAERDALGSTATGKTKTAKDMRTLADTVRAQQAKVAKYVFGPKEGEAVMQRLNALDVRYRRLMEATNEGDLSAAARMKGEAGREADRRFRAFAADDPTALAAWAAMRRHGPHLEQGVHDLVAAERIPVLGKVFSGIKLLGSFNRWMQERAAGSPVKFSEILNAMPDRTPRTVRDIVGGAAQRGAVQNDVLNGATQ